MAIPGKSGHPTYLIITKDKMVVARTAEEALDTMSLVNKSPVFVHYLINAKGKILGQIDTPLSEWTRSKIFPTEKLIEEWVRNPNLIPEGVSIDIQMLNTRQKVTFTERSKSGWFAQIGISEDTIFAVRSATQHMTA